ncbi:hypothetical protein Hanom_Chr07g00629071 [Helianthus anomalus]
MYVFILILLLIFIRILLFILIFIHSYLYVGLTRGIRLCWSHTYSNLNVLIYYILIRIHSYFQINVYLDSYTTSTSYADNATISIITGAHGIIVIDA